MTEDEKVIYKFLRSRVFKRYICILLCLVLYITVLPLPVSAEEAKSKTVRVGWYEGTYNTTEPDGKKRGYTKIHLVQLVLLSYMRPILTTEEIKKVFSLAFNEINDRSDDIISWETAYKIFSETQSQSIREGIADDIVDEEKLNNIIRDLNLNEKDENSIRTFVVVISLIAQASAIKKLVQKIVNEYHS